jgi:hypothetical protein
MGKVYLGDGAYAEFDGYAIVLTTSNGLHTTNTIVLEPVVMDSLIEFYMKYTSPKESPHGTT